MSCQTLDTDVIQLLSTRFNVIVSQDTDGRFRIDLFENDPPVT